MIESISQKETSLLTLTLTRPLKSWQPSPRQTLPHPTTITIAVARSSQLRIKRKIQRCHRGSGPGHSDCRKYARNSSGPPQMHLRMCLDRSHSPAPWPSRQKGKRENKKREICVSVSDPFLRPLNINYPLHPLPHLTDRWRPRPNPILPLPSNHASPTPFWYDAHAAPLDNPPRMADPQTQLAEGAGTRARETVQ